MGLAVEPNAETEGSGVLEDVLGNRKVFDREAERVDKRRSRLRRARGASLRNSSG